MKKVYQRIVDPGHGDCMQAAIASLFDDEYENVPPFIELGDNMGKAFDEYLESKGYVCDNDLHNIKWGILLHPTDECKEESKYYEPCILKPENMGCGVNGYFYCSVLSPKYFSWEHMGTHAVICDKDFNIVNDPNPEYKGIKSYPLASIIGFNGIIGVYNIRKK